MSEETNTAPVPAAEAAPAPAAEEAPKKPAISEAMRIVMGDVLDAQVSADDEAKAKRRGRAIPAGIAHITAGFNNTQCCITDARGNVLAWSSAGKAGFKGSRKSTAFAGTLVAQECAKAAIATSGMAVSTIKDITPMPHNGCRQRKRRKV